jgi:uncharacterized peroxidase-related enzyme
LVSIETDWRAAELDPRRVAMLQYAEKLTVTPAAVREDQVSALRQAGFQDADVLAIAEVVAYYAYVNRIADGLGVRLEPWLEASEP